MSGMSKAQEYRERAEECEQCSTPVEKKHWLVLADQWLSMAQELDLRLHKSNASGNGTGSRKGMDLGCGGVWPSLGK
jgi:hypothetical protein